MAFVTCPHCGTHVEEGSARCPACHGSLMAPARPPSRQGSWCPSCGVALSPGLASCPSCGLPLPQVPGAAGGGDADAQAPSRIEPALPAEPVGYEEPFGEDVTSRTPRVFVATVAALVFVGGIALAITHPWDPEAFSIKAKTEADTSMVGSPGTIERLTSQDGVADDGVAAQGQEEPLSPEEASYRTLEAAWESLSDLEGRLAASEERIRGIARDGADAQAAEDGARELGDCAIELSNLIAGIEEVDTTSGAYAEDAQRLSTLGNWLRNWADALAQAWEGAKAAGGAASAAITAPLDAVAGPDGTNAYRALFDENHGAWEPAAPPEGPARP